MWHPFTAWLWWVPNDLDIPAQLRLDPMLATAGVALIDPKVSDARKLLVSTVKKQGDTGAILDVCSVHFGTKDEATSVDENVAFAAVDALGTIVAANTADTSGSNRLAIDDRSTRLRVAADAYAELLAQDRIEMLPRAVHAPQTEIVICGLPGWELVRQQSPGTAASHDIENRVQDLADRVESWTAQGFGWWQKGIKTSKLSISKVGKVGAPWG